MRLCVIPARGGSKRIPRKNIKNFNGRPIIAWSIEAAQNSGCFDKIIVSTDDNEIADISKSFGAEVPFLRPENISDDFVATVDVMSHAIAWQNQKIPVSVACCLYATAPLTRPNDIKSGLEMLNHHNADYVFPITSFPYPIQRALRVKEDQKVEMINPDLASTRSQDLEHCYHDAGQFYWASTDVWLKKKPIFTSNSLGIIVPNSRVQDIDNHEDWERAEFLFQLLNKETN